MGNTHTHIIRNIVDSCLAIKGRPDKDDLMFDIVRSGNGAENITALARIIEEHAYAKPLSGSDNFRSRSHTKNRQAFIAQVARVLAAQPEWRWVPEVAKALADFGAKFPDDADVQRLVASSPEERAYYMGPINRRVEAARMRGNL